MLIMRNWKLLLAGLGLAAAFGAGWWLRPLPPPVSIEKEVVRKEIHEKIRIVERKPDGTIIERDEDRIVDERRKSESEKPVAVAQIPQGRYSLGIQMHPDLAYPLDSSKFSYTALMGYRPMEKLPLWAEAGWNWKRNEITLGVRLEF